MARPKHPIKELEALLKEATKQGWRVEGGGNRYFKIKCPCPDKHMRMVHLSPSNPNYLRNTENWLTKRTCWSPT